MRSRQIIQDGARRLQAAGIECAQREAEWLLGRLLHASPLELYVDDRPVGEAIQRRFFEQLQARATGLPLQYLLGDAEFLGRRFEIAPGVFIPRPETEVLVEMMIKALQRRAVDPARPLRLLELGTGSGCIAVSLAHALPACHVLAVELSWKALSVARRNVLRHRLEGWVSLVQGEWTAAIGGLFDGIVSNPPYVPTAQVGRLPRDVRQEPRLSLDGGEDGLRDLYQFIDEAPRLLRPGGLLGLECGEEQAAILHQRLRRRPWVERVEMVHDLANRPRGILATRVPFGG